MLFRSSLLPGSGATVTVFSGGGETLTDRWSGGYRGSLSQHGGALTFGYEFENQAGTISKQDVDRQDNGFYAHEQYAVNRWMSLTAGLRVQHSSRFGTETSPRGSVTFRLPTSTFFHVSVGRGVKEPALIENYAREAFYVGNPGLKPEVTNSFETGLYREWLGSRIRTDVVYFRNQFDNLIQFDFSKSPRSEEHTSELQSH